MISGLVSRLAQSSFDSSLYDDSYYYSSTSTDDAGATAAMIAFLGAYFFVITLVNVFFIVCQWKIFTKAGKPGWAAIVPVYNTIILLEIVGRPVWWIALMLVPFANLYVLIMVAIDLARAFGKSDGFAVLLVLLPIVGYPMLAFSKDAVYKKPAISAAPSV